MNIEHRLNIHGAVTEGASRMYDLVTPDSSLEKIYIFQKCLENVTKRC